MHLKFPCLDEENELLVGREKQIYHNEDMKNSCMEIEPSPPSNPYNYVIIMASLTIYDI